MNYKGIIYKYTSPSNKVYIGQTIQEDKRYRRHKSNAAAGHSGYFYNAIRKYGFYTFKYEVIFRVEAKTEDRLKCILDALEKYYIRKYKSRDENYGYNISIGGDGSRGFKHTEEHKQYLRDHFNESALMRPEIKEKAKQANIKRCSKTCY